MKTQPASALPQPTMQKLSGFQHRDLDFLSAFGLSRKKDGKMKETNNRSFTEPAKHGQRVKTSMDDWYASGGNERE